MTTVQKDALAPQKVYLKDYQAPGFQVSQIHLDFILNEDVTRVLSTMEVTATGVDKNLWLEGEELKLVSALVDGKPAQYELNTKGLMLLDVPAKFQLKI